VSPIVTFLGSFFWLPIVKVSAVCLVKRSKEISAYQAARSVIKPHIGAILDLMHQAFGFGAQHAIAIYAALPALTSSLH
jgi:hypothetical protein